MTFLRAASLLALAALAPSLAAACGDSVVTPSDGSSGGGGSTTSTTDTTSTTTTATTTSTGTSGGGGGAPDVLCGAGVCTGGDVCRVLPIAPECSNLPDGESCPEGTTETLCGGAGTPCCCGETPPPVEECMAPLGCEGAPPSCTCLEPSFCPEGRWCLDTATPGRVLCEEPPAA
jgi:hypothetical protein